MLVEEGGVAQTIYTIFLALWAAIYLNFWKRREAGLLYDWQMIGASTLPPSAHTLLAHPLCRKRLPRK
jgi:Calcium-activated chloride channel